METGMATKKTSFPFPPTRILRAYTDALAGFNYMDSPDGSSSTFFSKGHVLEQMTSAMGMVGRGDTKDKGEKDL